MDSEAQFASIGRSNPERGASSVFTVAGEHIAGPRQEEGQPAWLAGPSSVRQEKKASRRQYKIISSNDEEIWQWCRAPSHWKSSHHTLVLIE
jgi:hypothetical protein